MLDLNKVILYGGILVFLYIIYTLVRNLFSVYYTPGSNVIYDSPIAQKLFPREKGKLAPTWGYDSMGRLLADKNSSGKEEFWAESTPYVPNKSGYGGPSPSGGERNEGETMITSTEVGWWKDEKPEYKRGGIQNVYEDNSLPEKKVMDVGYWGY